MRYEYMMPEYGGGVLSIDREGGVTAELVNISDEDIEWDWPDDAYIYPSIDDWDWPDEDEEE